MELYFSPGACSMAPHIALREAGLEFELDKVDVRAKKTQNGGDYLKINPKGYVPALELDNNEVLTEAAVILQYIADRRPESGLAPKLGTMERYRLMEWLNFCATEIHKTLGALFKPNVTPEMRENQIALFGKRADILVQQLDGKPYAMGDKFTVVDAYLFTLLGWTNVLKVDTSKWPVLADYRARVAARPAVKETLRAEGLAK